MNNNVIAIVRSHKHLGVFLQRDARWSEHIGQALRKAKKRLDILRSFCKMMDKKSREKLYLSYIIIIIKNIYKALNQNTFLSAVHTF
jgi:hypothetical protein